MALTKQKLCAAVIISLIVVIPKVSAECAASDSCSSNLDPLPLKIIAIVAILISGTIGVSAPFLSRSIKAFHAEGNLFLITKTFASGIILATGFMHVLPDSIEMLSSECLSSNPWHKFPFSCFAAMVSAILTMTVDALATSIYTRRAGMGASVNDKEVEADQESCSPTVAGHAHSHPHVAHNADEKSQLLRYRVVATVLELGIVVHSVVIGLSVGASNNVCTIRGLVAALCFHQMFEGMGLGGCIFQANFRVLNKVVMIFFFSITTPLGIAMGIGLSKVYSEDSPKSLITVGLLNAASAGILIYMALVDLLSVEFMGKRLQGNMKVFFACIITVFLGMGSMSLLAVWS